MLDIMIKWVYRSILIQLDDQHDKELEMKKFTIVLAAFIIVSLIWFVYHSKSKKDEPLIMAMGDSLTNGYGDKNGEGYVDKLKQKLSCKKNIRIWNYGIVGQETDGVLKQLNDVRLKTKLDKADYFIVFIGTNDLINSNGGDLNPVHDRRITEGRQEFKKNYHKIVKTLATENNKAPILVIGLYNPYPNDRRIERHIKAYDQVIKETIKDDKRFIYIPTNDLFKDKDKSIYFSDALHPNEKGYQLITDRILQKYHF
jgi:lysophospholipase L1-like esterase